MSGRYLLDTSVVIPLFRGEEAIQERLDATEHVFLPAVALGELYFGAENSNQPEKHLTQIRELAAVCVFLPCDDETALYYGRLKKQLRTKGRAIPENDLWIASIALQHNLSLATRDVHFDAIEELESERW